MRKIVIDTRVIKHLGQDLITSSEVAVIELIKNAIDAKAKTINLRVCNHVLPKEIPEIARIANIPEKYLKMSMLLVEDDGMGMNDKTIDEGFLKIATSIKANEKDALGQKGIGRLATQRLGTAVLVETSSSAENHTSFVFIDWNAVINGATDVPSFEAKATSHHTRLWIFGINLEDFVDNAIELQQVSLFDGTEATGIPIQINRDLRSALNFMISPFRDETTTPEVNFYFDNKKIDISFPAEMLKLAESVHSFSFSNNENAILTYGLTMQPWFVERVHRALVKAEAFKRLRKSHAYYAELLQRNSKRIDNALKLSLTKDDLQKLFCQFLSEFYANNDSSRKSEVFEKFILQKTDDMLAELSKITPIKGSIYSFKQGAAIGDKIIIDAAFELKYTASRYSLNDLKRFLEDYNGVKLYRGIYRIGFLGDKESDWIKLQQFRTKGQQWYRFDLGNTVGAVSLSDASQENIQEISSRLDISENKTSIAFKMLINVVFNHLLYELNRKANDIIKVLLAEEGVLGENLSKRVKKSDADLKEMIRRNVRMQKALQSVSQYIEQGRKIKGKNQVVMPEKSFEFVANTIKSIDNDIKADSAAQERTAALLSEANEQLKAIEVESYNNYKLMANGLITETITHELHSLSKTGISPKTEDEFEFLKNYFVSNSAIPTYNHHVIPIRNSYRNMATKLEQVGDLYSFLETTFIKRGTIDEFVYQNILSVVNGITNNLKKTIDKERISIVCKTGELSWLVPKGVLLHVFYNLINNSLYWIDVRRKWARSDSSYASQDADMIMIEEYGVDGIVVSDTGTGVSHHMEDILFQPLESGKLYSEGRGMGLYIVKKLLNSFGGEIELMEEKNRFGNRYKFLLVNNASEDL